MVVLRAIFPVCFLVSSLLVGNAESAANPIVIGHRGACGYRPEHTIESYTLAIEMGADFIEPDLVSTKDGVLIARHENEISETTDVAQKFQNRRTTKEIDGKKVEGFFTEDFTFAEIKTLRAKERLPKRNHSYDGQFMIPTFEEILNLVAKQQKAKKRVIGIYPETKHPTYFKTIGLELEPKIVSLLERFGYRSKESPIFLQSFELSSLERLNSLTSVPKIFLMEDPKWMAEVELAKIAKVADGIGPYKRFIVPTGKDGHLGEPTNLIKAAHKLGLKVHPFTFRSDPDQLDPSYHGDARAEYLQFYDLGVDGLFSDFPDQALRAREEWSKLRK